MLAEGGIAVSNGSQVLTAVILLKNTICRLVNATSETVQQLEFFDTLPSEHSAPPLLMEEARSWLQSTDSHRTLVAKVVEGMRLSSTLVLLKGRYS